MADNVPITTGSDETIASDDIGGVQFQRVKLALGADGAHDMDLDSGQQAKASSVPVAIASDQDALEVVGDVAHDAADSGNPVKVGGKAATSTPSAVANGDRVDAFFDEYGRLNVKSEPLASGGLDTFRSVDVDESEEEIKSTAGQVFGWFLFNGASSTLYVKFYNATAASVTVGTTTPFLTIPIPAGAGANVEFMHGIEFDTAITIAATTGVADSDTGAPGANELVANVFYK